MALSAYELLARSLPQLGEGLWATLKISLVTIMFSVILGTGFGVLRTSRRFVPRLLSGIVLELVRSVPILVWLFFFFFGLPILFDVHLSAFGSALLVLSLWGMTEIGEIVRGALQSLPKGQTEAGKSLGLSGPQLLVYVLVPQALRRMVPPAINVFTRIVMTSSLTVLVGVTELIKSGQQIIERHYTLSYASVVIYGLMALLYFALCYPLSVFSRRLERRWTG
ncbi:amino acid ABC transporter permease [Paenibacillus sp. UNC499MF]|uniref:amino acid ABC transporter permease n=1 Tax=Paenibacillus sp. UNC499MF TaxID=1502751 RepID=UPI00089FAB7F|nr:amino acid ABC transporter permease [Paenibacillus sp. UNC499MF]SEF69250.1 polar amino acid transport system permease protein [Paenibacillus sp. UNC499MF]